MSLIIKDKIPMFIVGYPTVSDKYNVAGGTLAGNTPVKFGQLVKHSATKGYFEAITGAITLADIAGFVLATNVKLNELWPEGNVQVNPGEAFNLMVNGFMAIELDSGAVEGNIKPNQSVCLILASGKITTEYNNSTAPYLDSVVFTGAYEKHGNTLIAEIYIK